MGQAPLLVVSGAGLGASTAYLFRCALEVRRAGRFGDAGPAAAVRRARRAGRLHLLAMAATLLLGFAATLWWLREETASEYTDEVFTGQGAAVPPIVWSMGLFLAALVALFVADRVAGQGLRATRGPEGAWRLSGHPGDATEPVHGLPEGPGGGHHHGGHHGPGHHGGFDGGHHGGHSAGPGGGHHG